jgi:predicted PurR-regulated permease PerM
MIERRLPWPLVFQVLGVVAAAVIVVAPWPLWLLSFAALVLAAAMLPAARLGERYRVPRGVTVLVVYLAVGGLMTLMGRLLWPALAEQFRQFMEQLPRLIANVKIWVGDVQGFVGQWGATMTAPETGDLQGASSCWRCW